MAIVRCGQGHFYDNSKSKECPVCKKEKENQAAKEADAFRDRQTVSAYQLAGEPSGKNDSETVWLKDAGANAKNREDAKTIGIYSAFKGNDFVTGWLVCVSGPERGRDYRLHYGFNRIGRGLSMDICILEDEMISRNAHCSVVYDHKKNAFSLVPTGGCLTYVQGEALTAPMPLVTGDRFVIGETELEFIAFCREDVRWDTEEKETK